ncbi:MAG: DUF1893 domain-containing protein [Clostridia bacterium]|nr:DUF1893 domain-containing protein [Clostridia bacterium]
MTKLEEVKEILHQKNASLVVCYANGEVKEYYQDRIKDIKAILQENQDSLKGAVIADKVIGKVASSILAIAGVKEIYAEVISKFAILVLEENGIQYEYLEKVEFIKNKDNTGMCPMENKYREENDIHKIYNEMLNL